VKIPLLTDEAYYDDPPAPDPDNDILDLHAEHLAEINKELQKELHSRVGLIEDIGNHSLLGNGKRLRPLLFVLSCKLCDYRGKDIYSLSTLFEYIHTASLLHDDVLDNAHIRRKKPSANTLWGNHAAVLEGDFLYSKAFSIAVASGKIPFLETLTRTTTQMAEGQILELIHTNDWDTTEEEYMEIISAKTAVLISAACAGGAIVSGRTDGFVNALTQFGFHIGIAFQIMDDLLDYTSSEKVFGKPVGKDVREGKITLPLIYTLGTLGESKRKRLASLFRGGKATERDHMDLIDLVRGNGALDRILAQAERYVLQAGACLERFPDSPFKQNLLGLSRYIVERSY
jgi:octaprenyl-diphosphate synthase